MVSMAPQAFSRKSATFNASCELAAWQKHEALWIIGHYLDYSYDAEESWASNLCGCLKSQIYCPCRGQVMADGRKDGWVMLIPRTDSVIGANSCSLWLNHFKWFCDTWIYCDHNIVESDGESLWCTAADSDIHDRGWNVVPSLSPDKAQKLVFHRFLSWTVNVLLR